MRKLEIDWGELEVAFESGIAEMEHYLDLETGKVLMVTQETRWYMEEPLDEELQGWQQEMLQTARQIEEGYGSRYISVPRQDSQAGYRDLERFIGTVQDRNLQDQLWVAVQGSEAWRRFKDVLLEHPAEQEQWFAFSERCVHARMLAWLESAGIEPTNAIEPPDVSAVGRPDAPLSETATGAMTPTATLVEDLTLLLIYLTSWQEQPVNDFTVHRAWKGYLFEVLDVLEEKGLIQQSRRAKSLYLTQEGIEQAQKLEQEYGKR